MEDTYSYRGWLVSDSFIKRALAIWGYTMVIQVIIIAVLFILSTVLAAFIFGMGAQ